MKTVLMASLFMIGCAAQAREEIPLDVQAFIHNAAACEHFAGEFDGDLSVARQKEIERSVVKYCQRAQMQLKKLSVRYKNDARLMELIRSNANESVTSFR